MTPAEVQKIVEYEADPRARLIVLLGCLCGLRMGEARALTVDKIDLKNQTIRIDANVVKKSEGVKPPKYDSRRTIPAPDVVLDGIQLLQRAYPGKYAVPNYADLNRPVDASAF
ncbi:MAG TPA: tyrosine-type recombinase/integrase, partial [Treponema sp.]|nr:tyrosine-type recombinase/integrase [Treponema sp.]